MRCAQCDVVITSDNDMVWIRGTAVCPACMQKGRALQQTFLKAWVAFALLTFLIPILLFCLIGGVFFFGFWLPERNRIQQQNEQFEREFKKKGDGWPVP